MILHLSSLQFESLESKEKRVDLCMLEALQKHKECRAGTASMFAKKASKEQRSRKANKIETQSRSAYSPFRLLSIGTIQSELQRSEHIYRHVGSTCSKLNIARL